MPVLKHIVLIDDDLEDLEIFSAAIRSLCSSAICSVFSDAQEALFKLTAGEVSADMVFIDLRMPDMSGQEFLQEFKRQRALTDIPVIVLSDSSDESSIRVAKEKGASAFITKPSAFSKIRECLRPVLAGTATADC